MAFGSNSIALNNLYDFYGASNVRNDLIPPIRCYFKICLGSIVQNRDYGRFNAAGLDALEGSTEIKIIFHHRTVPLIDSVAVAATIQDPSIDPSMTLNDLPKIKLFHPLTLWPSQ